MKQKPLVSILINNYNYAKFLAEAIDSAINQTYENIEVIVVDDGSTDNSREIIASYGKKVIPIIKENGGQASAFNAGFAKSRGSIICFLDADDLFVANKIEKIARVFYETSDVAWCFHPLKFVDKEHKSLNIEQKYTGRSGVYDIRNSLQQGKLNGKLPFNIIATSGLCYRRSLLEQLLPMSESIRITSDDYLKYAAFALTSGYVLLEELSWQTIHDNNAYTLRTDKDELRAKINIATAYLLKEKIPSIIKFTNNIFALGLSIHRKLAQKEQNTLALIEAYFSDLKITDKIEINLRSFYYGYKK
jgi:glycosyltransferase involved in cell wall biosynthesis